MDWYSPTLLEPETHAWAQRLRPYVSILESLEHNPLLPCLLRGYNASTSQMVEQIVKWIEETPGDQRRKIADLVLADLDLSGRNAEEIEGELASISSMTSKGVEPCMKMLGVYSKEAIQFAKIYLSGLFQTPDLSGADRNALMILATRCGLKMAAALEAPSS